MNILFIGKRFYTNRDAYRDRFGRVFQLPYWWASAGEAVSLVLLDYHSRERWSHDEGNLAVRSLPVVSFRMAQCFMRQIVRRGGWQVVIGSGDCYIGLMAWLIARANGAAFVFDVYDRYDLFGAYTALPFFDPFRFLLRRADLRSFASRALPDLVGPRSGADVLIPNGVDTDLFFPQPIDRCRGLLGLPAGEIFAGYFGSTEDDRGVDDLVAAVAILNNRGLAVRLLLAGRNPPRRVVNNSLVLYLGDLPFREVPLAMGCADVLVIPYRRSPMMDQGASCKIGEYLAVGRPVVTTRTPNFLGNFARQAQELDGAVCEPGDPHDLARAIELQLRSPRLATLPDHLSWRRIAMDSLAALRARAALRRAG